ncbi:MAG: cell division protein ZapA [SAR324 cluster bacterium]|nr:cell division protein ZapA [SAR324 cluster bacterium]
MPPQSASSLGSTENPPASGTEGMAVSWSNEEHCVDEHDLKQYQININGNRFAVASPYGEEHIREVERYLEEQMNEVRQQSDLTSPSQLALLLALNFADEILTLQKRQVHLDELERSLSSMTQRLESALQSQSDAATGA